MDQSTRPKSAESHDGNCLKVCAPCGKKITVKEIRPISDKINMLLVQFINPEFDLTKPVYPKGICNNTCKSLLRNAEKDGKTDRLPKMLNYEDIVLPKMTRTTDPALKCNCYICLTACSHAKNKRMSSEYIDVSCGKFGNYVIKKLPPKSLRCLKKVL